jgi:class 3 adenylate cyclase
MSARRVQRSFAFIDMCGFTAYMDERGDQDAVQALSAMRAAIRSAAEEFGVRVAKWLGDGAMIVGVEHPPLVECTLAIQTWMPPGPWPPLRGGVCTGQVLLFEGDDYVGRAVNIAARLCAAAAPGQILVADERPGVAEQIGLGERAAEMVESQAELSLDSTQDGREGRPMEVRGISNSIRVRQFDRPRQRR